VTARIGKYVIEAELGSGAMGIVYRARDPDLGRPVALKMILDPARAGPDEVERFRREGMAAARLNHSGIVQVYETGEHEGRPFMALELVEGESLEALLERAPLSPRRAAELVRGVALALAHAHAEGIVHRDVKPGNVLVDREGAPHLMDFGLARNEAATARLTATGDVLGTPLYMAPEQANGDLGAQGPPTDVWALGGVLYRALAGRPPFEASNVQGLLYKILTEEPPAPRTANPRIHPDLETIVLRCLAKDPGRRYPGAQAVADDLGRFLDGEPILARRTGPFERAVHWVRRNRLAATTSGLTLVTVFGVLPVAWAASAEAQRRLARDRAAEARRQASALVDRAERCRLAGAARAVSVPYDEGRHRYDTAALGRALAGYDEAVALCSSALVLDRQLWHARIVRARALLGRFAIDGDVASQVRAADDLDEARAELEPGDAAGHAQAAMALAEESALVVNSAGGDSDSWFRGAEGAVDEATRALALAPGSADVLLARAAAFEVLAGTDTTRHLTGLLAPHLRQGLADATEALRLQTANARALALRARLRTFAAVNGHNGSADPDVAALASLDLAAKDADEAVRLDPRSAETWASRAFLAHALLFGKRALTAADEGAAESALADVGRALALDTRNRDALYNAIFFQETLRDRAGCLDASTRYLAAYPFDAMGWRRHALTELNLGKLAEAEDDASIGLRIDRVRPDGSARALLLIVRSTARLGRNDVGRALDDSLEALEAGPRSIWAKTLVAAAERAHREPEALETLGKAIDADPSLLEPRYARFALRSRMGDRAGTLEDARAFLELAPSDDPRRTEVEAALGRR
jgi:hypothetical protein